MKIGTRLFLAYLAVIVLCLYYPMGRLADTANTIYRESVEDALVDQANILAAIVEQEFQKKQFTPEHWKFIFSRVHSRILAAKIYQLQKTGIDSHIYITDEKGIILFDSEQPENVGKDFSRWRDVHRTLLGEYGARTTRRLPDDEMSSTLYVAAPILVNGAIAGVLTVGKPTTNIVYFLENARYTILKNGIISLSLAGILCLLVTYWLTKPIKRLTRYARGIRDGENPTFPKLDSSEIGEMGQAFAEMQETLEGKKYVEQYIEHLTHELKSPLSAIRGAAELLGEPMDASQQQRFIANISSQSKRIQEIVDRMLELAALESRSYQRASETVPLHSLVHKVCTSKEPFMIAKHLQLTLSIPEHCTVRADGFLLHQALSNLVQNAIDFSPHNGTISVTVSQEHQLVTIAVCDQGPGIPDYAGERVFEKFFSLQRPDTKQKSTGLGLNFVQQVARLHNGQATLKNNPTGGCCAALTIPVA